MAETKLGEFEATRSAAFSSGVIYQAYVTDHRLVAVKIGTPLEGGKAITAHFGLLGGIVQYFLDKGVQKRRAALRAANAERSLDELLLADKKNFEVRFDAIERAELNKPGLLGLNAKAHLLLKPVGQEVVKLELQTKEQVTTALQVLGKGLQGRLVTDPKLRTA